jgi:hypothetical protein
VKEGGVRGREKEDGGNRGRENEEGGDRGGEIRGWESGREV